MTSLDDTIISRQNLMLLDNVTNYSKPALDYFHHEFDYSKDVCLSWGLLLKMRKHKVLRLPSCSNEDDMDYNIYLERLHHCLWRRWSMNLFKLEDKKLNPLSINWNKDTDVTVLYGPDLSVSEDEQKDEKKQQVEDKQKSSLKSCLSHSVEEDETAEYYNDFSTEKYNYSSSVSSSTSSIFDKTYSEEELALPKKKSIRFDDAVFKRVIDHSGKHHEIYTIINDKKDQWRREQKRIFSRSSYKHSQKKIESDIQQHVPGMNDSAYILIN
ncbi:Uncharacterized protein RNJ44_03604 [Nakaseomyces bracarensis]|uniref:Uncharacterized protein n=1 Tax=Nakaseomyces bracarensis TaxID=273131 RepID=A0ABR4NXI8_9SACH